MNTTKSVKRVKSARQAAKFERERIIELLYTWGIEGNMNSQEDWEDLSHKIRTSAPRIKRIKK